MRVNAIFPETPPGDVDARLLRLRVELWTALQTLKGDSLVYLKAMIGELAATCGEEYHER